MLLIYIKKFSLFKMKNHKIKTSRRSWSSMFLLLLLILIGKFEGTSSAAAAISSGNETDWLALLDFKNHISKDPNEFLNSWNESHHHCLWPGIICDVEHRRVMGIDLHGQSLFGSISPHIGNLSFLKSIDMRNNQLYGELPQEIGRLRRLRYIFLANNTLEGEIPVNITSCVLLRVISTVNNRLIGQIPFQLGSLVTLDALLLGGNNLSGEIPPSLGNLTSLTRLYLANNNLKGQLPQELGQLRSLFAVGLDSNEFSGTLPMSLLNISSLAGISVPDNFLHGNLPAEIGQTLPNLQELYLGGNRFEGIIPASFANASFITILEFPGNNFVGKVPDDFGKLSNLYRLNVQHNSLGSNTTGDLNFIESLSNCSNLNTLLLSSNNFGGKLPNFIGNLSKQLQQIDIALNQISGEIPEEITNLANLYLLGMDHNLFTGSIPSSLGKFSTLQKLFLNNNKLSGIIPPSLFNATSLYGLYLVDNMLEGNIPQTIGNAQALHEFEAFQNELSGTIPLEIFRIPSLSLLNLSSNLLSGPLSLEIGGLKNIYSLDVSDNKLSGVIPGTIGQCLSLEYISMEGNSFEGSIPSSLISLKGIQVLDLSRNNLTGQIPQGLELLPFVQFVNLSLNNLEGQVTTDGFYGNSSLVSLDGNSKLCGGIPQLKLPSCNIKKTKGGSKSLAIKIIVPLVVLGLILVVLFTFFVFFYKRKDTNVVVVAKDEDPLRISYRELRNATDGFSPSNLIGKGGFGAVYIGQLNMNGEKFVAIKVLDLHKKGAIKSFVAECTALRNIRHRNLVTVLTCCSSSDFEGREFKALVYEYLSNGDLDMWLHSGSDSSKTLNMSQRLSIAVDVACALDYLHNDCETPVVHRDLKPSNVLLDENLTAHVGDFGLAKLLYDNNDQQQNNSSTGIRGTFGYAAPEYGMGGQASTDGDVYSFGILLLEMSTGRRPTDEIFKDGLDLHEYVKRGAAEEVVSVADPRILAKGVEFAEEKAKGLQKGEGLMQECLISLFNIGLSCSSSLPRERKSIKDVVYELKALKNAIFAKT